MTSNGHEGTGSENRKGTAHALVLYKPVDLVAVVNTLSGVNVMVEPERIETIDKKLAEFALPIYVEQGWLQKTRAETGPPEWLRYKGQKKVKGKKRDIIQLPPKLSFELESQAKRFLREAWRIAQRDPTLEGGAFVYNQIMEAYRVVLQEGKGVDLFQHPSLCDDARSPLNWFIRSAFARVRLHFATKSDLLGLMKQLLVPSAVGYMFGATPTKDYHDEFVPIFEEATRRAKSQVNALLQERNYGAETLRPISDVVRAAEMHGVRIVPIFR